MQLEEGVSVVAVAAADGNGGAESDGCGQFITSG